MVFMRLHRSLVFLEESYFMKKSILGICLGHQTIAEYFGCKLKNMINVKHGVSSKNLVVANDPLFDSIPMSFRVGHYHSWVIDESCLSEDLNITSRNTDSYIMSFRHNKYDVCGVQFHPESILTDYGSQILKNWISY